MTKGLGAKSGHEPLFLMTADSVGNCNEEWLQCEGRRLLQAYITHCHDRMEELTAPVCLSVVPLVSRVVSRSKFWVVWRFKKKKNKKHLSIRGSVREGSCKRLWWKTPELCAVLGVWRWVWWGQWKNLVSHSLCVPVHVLVEWQPTNSSTVWF